MLRKECQTAENQGRGICGDLSGAWGVETRPVSPEVKPPAEGRKWSIRPSNFLGVDARFRSKGAGLRGEDVSKKLENPLDFSGNRAIVYAVGGDERENVVSIFFREVCYVRLSCQNSQFQSS